MFCATSITSAFHSSWTWLCVSCISRRVSPGDIPLRIRTIETAIKCYNMEWFTVTVWLHIIQTFGCCYQPLNSNPTQIRLTNKTGVRAIINNLSNNMYLEAIKISSVHKTLTNLDISPQHPLSDHQSKWHWSCVDSQWVCPHRQCSQPHPHRLDQYQHQSEHYRRRLHLLN